MNKSDQADFYNQIDQRQNVASSQSLLIEKECFNTIPVLCPAPNNNIIISLDDLEDFDFMEELEDAMAIEPVVPIWTKFVNNGMKDPKFISAINSVNTHGKKFANFNVSNPNNNQMPISEKKKPNANFRKRKPIIDPKLLSRKNE